MRESERGIEELTARLPRIRGGMKLRTTEKPTGRRMRGGPRTRRIGRFTALKVFKVYLLGIRFKIVTDCRAIRATALKKDIQPRVARWWVYLQDYDFDIIYRPGGGGDWHASII